MRISQLGARSYLSYVTQPGRISASAYVLRAISGMSLARRGRKRGHIMRRYAASDPLGFEMKLCANSH